MGVEATSLSSFCHALDISQNDFEQTGHEYLRAQRLVRKTIITDVAQHKTCSKISNELGFQNNNENYSTFACCESKTSSTITHKLGLDGKRKKNN